jgi:hypothetical protein
LSYGDGCPAQIVELMGEKVLGAFRSNIAFQV